MKLFSILYICCIFLTTHFSLFSQTPTQKWEFVKYCSSVEKEFLHGYNVGVSKEGFTFVSCDHNDQYPIMIALLPNASELFTFENKKDPSLEFFFKIRSISDNIYKNNCFDERSLFGIQNTWTDSSLTKFMPADVFYNRVFLKVFKNSDGEFNKSNINFHSTCPSEYHEMIKFVSHGFSFLKKDSILLQTAVFQMPNDGQINLTLDSFTIGTIHNDEYTSIPKPQAMRWYTNVKKLGIMICPDTVIPTSKTIVQVRRSNIVKDIDAKFDDIVNLNPYLVQNFAGKRLKWKGFTNSSFGFVALFENLDDENRNILFRYSNQNSVFSTVTLKKTIDCRSIFLDSIGRLVVVGANDTEGNSDFYLGFYNQQSELQEKVWGASEFDRLNDVIIDSFGEIAVSGQKGNDLYLAKFTLNATSVSDQGTKSLPTLFVSQENIASNKGEIVLENLESGNTTVKLYSLQGIEVSTIYEGTTIGHVTYRFPIQTVNLPSGVYLVVVQNNHNTITKKFIHVK